MEEWKEYTVQQLIDLNYIDEPLDGNHGGKHPKSTDYVPEGVPFIMANDLANGKLDLENCVFITQKQADSLDKGFAKPGDVLLTHKATLGRTAIVPDTYPMIVLTPQVTYYRCKKNIENKYLKYYFDSPEFQTILANWAGSGSTRAYLGITAQHKLPIVLPPLPTQQKIAAILSSLDDKIELNNKINTNLEQQAQALFKNWFVDFEPFGGKMPEGWKEGTLSDISTYSSDKIDVSDLTLSTYYSTENMLPNKMGIEDASSLPTIKQTTRCYPGETIISNIRPYFKKIYYCSEEIAGCSTDVLCFKPHNLNYSEYLYQTLYSDTFFAYMVLGSKGTKMPRGDKQQIMNYSITIPDEQYLLKYKTFAEPIFSQIDINRKENKRLSVIRDTLLPKLMNGKIEVNINEI